MSVLIVTESLFGNTLSIAEAIGGGVAEVCGRAGVRVVHASQAPGELPVDVDLLVVGAPTHTLSMPNAGSRGDAVRRAAESATAPGAQAAPGGVREWIAQVSIPDGVSVATFDTSIHTRIQLGTAARSAARALRRRGARATVGPSFWVTGMEGPLADGELARATAWGRELAQRSVRAS